MLLLLLEEVLGSSAPSDVLLWQEEPDVVVLHLKLSKYDLGALLGH